MTHESADLEIRYQLVAETLDDGAWPSASVVFDSAPIGMAVLDADPVTAGRFLRVNPALCAFLGRSAAELLGTSWHDVVWPLDRPAGIAALADLLDGRLSSMCAEPRFISAATEPAWGLVTTVVARDEKDRPQYVLHHVVDTTEQRRVHESLIHQALHDPLTGLPNRALLIDHLAGALTRRQRADKGHVAVLFLDLDNFKAVNDSLGHLAGDELLVGVTKRLSSCLRESDTAARLGGDEFVVICEEVATPDEALLVARRIQVALRPDIAVQGKDVAVSASIGIALSGNDSMPGDLLRDADAAMYRAKRRGPGSFEVADDALHTAALRELTLEAVLRKAARRGNRRGSGARNRGTEG